MSGTGSPLGRITGPVSQAGQCLLFLFRMLAGVRFSASQIITVLQQTYLIGARSLVIIMICGFFVGMVLSLQAINALEQFGAELDFIVNGFATGSNRSSEIKSLLNGTTLRSGA